MFKLNVTKWVVCMAILFSFSMAQAQKKHLIGIKTGGIVTSSSSSDFKNNSFSSQLGYLTGVTYDLKVNKYFQVGGELLFEKRRIGKYDIAQNSDRTTRFGYDFIHRFNYLTVPLKGEFVLGNKLFGTLGGGVLPAVLISANKDLVTFNPDGSIDQDGKVDIKDNISNFNLGGFFNASVGYTFKEKFSLDTSVRYDFSSPKYNGLIGTHLGGMQFALGLKYALI